MGSVFKIYLKKFFILLIPIGILDYLLDLITGDAALFKTIIFTIFISAFLIWMDYSMTKSNMKSLGGVKLAPKKLLLPFVLKIKRPMSLKELLIKIEKDPYLAIKGKQLEQQKIIISVNRPNATYDSLETIQWEELEEGGLLLTLTSGSKFKWRKTDYAAYHFSQVKFLEKVLT